MLTILFIYLVVLLFLEVLLGSNIGIYNAEIGYDVTNGKMTKLTFQQFFLQLLPFASLTSGGVWYLLNSLFVEHIAVK